MRRNSNPSQEPPASQQESICAFCRFREDVASTFPDTEAIGCRFPGTTAALAVAKRRLAERGVTDAPVHIVMSRQKELYRDLDWPDTFDARAIRLCEGFQKELAAFRSADSQPDVVTEMLVDLDRAGAAIRYARPEDRTPWERHQPKSRKKRAP